MLAYAFAVVSIGLLGAACGSALEHPDQLHPRMLKGAAGGSVRAGSLRLLPDGRIVVVGVVSDACERGSGCFFAARLRSDGSADPEFGTKGVSFFHGFGDEDGVDGLVADDDGSIWMSATAIETFSPKSKIEDPQTLRARRVFRLDERGALDASFGDRGAINPDPTASWPFPDAVYGLERVGPDTVVTGSGVRIREGGSVAPITRRITGNAMLVSVAGSASIVESRSDVYANRRVVRVSIQRIAASGTQPDPVELRRHADQSDGLAPINVAIQHVAAADEHVLYLLTNERHRQQRLVRLRDGVVDDAFGEQDATIASMAGAHVPGGARLTLGAIAVDGRGRILATGRIGDGNRSALMRILPNGTLDTSYGRNGFAQRSGDHRIYGAQVAADGSVLALVDGGDCKDSVSIVRIDASGRIDASFGARSCLALSARLRSSDVDPDLDPA